jgi:hypothetical protein
MIRSLCVASLLSVFAVSSAMAASVTVTFKPQTGNATKYDVLASVTPAGGDVLGLAGFDFEVTGTAAAGITWTPGKIFAIDENTFSPIGFTTRVAGVVGGAGSTRFSVGAVQDPSNTASNVHNIGLAPVAINGPGPNDIDLQVPALLGTITGPAGLTLSNFNSVVGAQLFPAGGGQAVLPTALNVVFDGGVVAPAPDLGLMATNGAGLSAALQGVWNSKVSGTSISLIDGLMITNDDPNSDVLAELGAIGTSVEITNYAGQGVIGTVSAGTVPGKYSLLLTGPFQSFDPSIPLTGNVNFTSALGGNASLAFSVAVPEPSTVALSALALVGLVGFARRKK